MKIYTDRNGVEFRIIDVEPTDAGVWIHYERVSDKKEFSCLLDAFNERFTELEIAR